MESGVSTEASASAFRFASSNSFDEEAVLDISASVASLCLEVHGWGKGSTVDSSTFGRLVFRAEDRGVALGLASTTGLELVASAAFRLRVEDCARVASGEGGSGGEPASLAEERVTLDDMSTVLTMVCQSSGKMDAKQSKWRFVS